jgi:hypothetical protein
MRSLLLKVAASAGLGLILLTTTPANSITITTPAGVRQAADGLDLAEAVHCRKYSHRHKRGHGWGRGCRAKAAKAVSTGPQRSGVVGSGGSIIAPAGGGTTVRPNWSNPQDRIGKGNPQDLTQPRSINPQDRR